MNTIFYIFKKLVLLLLFFSANISTLQGDESNWQKEYRNKLEKAGYTSKEIDELVEKEIHKKKGTGEDPLPKEVQIVVDQVEENIQDEIDDLTKYFEKSIEQTISDFILVQKNLLRSVTTKNINEALDSALLIRKYIEEYQRRTLKSLFTQKKSTRTPPVEIENIIKTFDKKMDAKKNEHSTNFDKIKTRSIDKLKDVQKKVVREGNLEKALAIKKVIEIYEDVSFVSYILLPKEGLEKNNSAKTKSSKKENSDISDHLKNILKNKELTLEKIADITILDLIEHRLTDDDIKGLTKHLKSIKTLLIGKNKGITDKVLSYIKDIPTLETLGLRNTNVTGKGIIMQLKDTNIKTLNLSKNINAQDVEKIKKMLPECKVRLK